MNAASPDTILIIEDQASFREIYCDILEHAGYRVLQAEDGASGISEALRHQPDLILLDLILPKVHGFDVLRRLKQHPTTQATPVIIFSVTGDIKDIQQALSLGASDFTFKGLIAPADFLKKIKCSLERIPAGQQPETIVMSIGLDQTEAIAYLNSIGARDKARCSVCNHQIALFIRKVPGPGIEPFSCEFLCQGCRKKYSPGYNPD